MLSVLYKARLLQCWRVKAASYPSLLFSSGEDEMVQCTVMQKCLATPASNGLRAATKVPKTCNGQLDFRRGIQDVSISRTGKPIIRIQGGRYAEDSDSQEDCDRTADSMLADLRLEVC